MSEKTRSWRLRRASRTRRVQIALLGLSLAVLAALPAAGFAKGEKVASPQADQLSVFSWWTGPGEHNGLAKIITMWNKAHPTLKVKDEAVAGGAGSNAKAVLAQRLAAKKPPDTFQWHAGQELLDYIKAGYVEPIDFVYAKYKLTKVFPAQLISQIKYKGKLYSVPVNIHRANVLWYSKTAMKKAGIASVPTTWAQFIAALKKADDAGLIPLSLGQDWTEKHLMETVFISTLGPTRWAALWTKGGNWNQPGVTTALNRFKELLTYVNSDFASLTWQDATKLVADDKAVFNVMGDWAEGYLRVDLKQKANVDYGWSAVPGTGGVYDWLSDSFTLPKGAPHRSAAIEWLGLVGSKRAQDAFNPLKGSIPARKDANPKLYGTYLKWALQQWKQDKLAGSLAHGVVAPLAWSTDIDTALGLFIQSKDVAKFQTALAAAHDKRAT
jgi:glucose/mannose transport system substrate-binding protein